MRSDLNKQLCERERIGSKRRYKDVRRAKKFDTREEDGEGVAGREGMSSRHVRTGQSKDFNENFNPLWGAIRKAVGRKWDSFYSDLCKVFDKRSVINQHILQHLEQFVERSVFEDKDGELIVRGKYSLTEYPLKGSSTEYYVDPRDGILKYNKHYKSYRQVDRERAAQAAKELDRVFRIIDEYNVLHLIDGVWFHFTLKDIPKGEYVFEKPLDKDLFKASYGNKMKSWAQLSQLERSQHGRSRFVGERANDVLTGSSVYSDGKTPRYRHHTETIFPIGNRYHATKQTASHKLLKKAGLV